MKSLKQAKKKLKSTSEVLIRMNEELQQRDNDLKTRAILPALLIEWRFRLVYYIHEKRSAAGNKQPAWLNK